MLTENDATPNEVIFAAKLYAAYTANSGNKNYQGLECPAWEALTPAVRGHWCAVAREARRFPARVD